MTNILEQIFGINKYMKIFHSHLTFPPLGGNILQKLQIALVLWVHTILFAFEKVTPAY